MCPPKVVLKCYKTLLFKGKCYVWYFPFIKLNNRWYPCTDLTARTYAFTVFGRVLHNPLFKCRVINITVFVTRGIIARIDLFFADVVEGHAQCARAARPLTNKSFRGRRPPAKLLFSGLFQSAYSHFLLSINKSAFLRTRC